MVKPTIQPEDQQTEPQSEYALWKDSGGGGGGVQCRHHSSGRLHNTQLSYPSERTLRVVGEVEETLVDLGSSSAPVRGDAQCRHHSSGRLHTQALHPSERTLRVVGEVEGTLDLSCSSASPLPSAKANVPQQQQEGDEEAPNAAAAAPAIPRWEDPNRPIVWQLIDYVRHRSWQKKVLTVLFVATAAVVYADLFGLFWDGKIHAGIAWFLEWMDQNSVGAVFAFIGMFILTTLVFIPPSLLIFGAGFVFVEVYGFEVGIALAMAACFAGSIVGAIIAFVRARYMMRDLVKLFARRYPLIRAVDKGLKRKGFRVMLLLRLCSLIPFSALNYIGGVTGVRWGAFTCSLVGLLPSLQLTVFLGATAGSLAGDHDDISEEDRIVSIIWMSVIGACGLLAVVMTIYFARKELIKEMERESREAESAQSSTRSTNSNANEEWLENESERGMERKYEEGVDDEEWFWVWA